MYFKVLTGLRLSERRKLFHEDEDFLKTSRQFLENASILYARQDCYVFKTEKLKNTTLLPIPLRPQSTPVMWLLHRVVVWVSDPERGRVMSLQTTSSWLWPLNLLPLDLCKLNKPGVWWFIATPEIQTNKFIELFLQFGCWHGFPIFAQDIFLFSP